MPKRRIPYLRTYAREWRIHCGVTVRGLAQKLGVDKNHVMREERKECMPAEQRAIWAEALGVAAERLLEPPAANTSLTGVAEAEGPHYETTTEDDMGPLTIQLERLLEKYGHKKVSDRLDEMEARRRTAATPRPQQRR